MSASHALLVIGIDGETLDSRFSLDCGDETSFVLESRGGTLRARNARNLEYAAGLTALLHRLKSIGAVVTDAIVDSAVTRAMGLSRSDCRLETCYTYPIDLSAVDDLEELRLALCAAQRPIGRKPGAKGLGNNTKRIRVYFEQTCYQEREILEEALSGWASPHDSNGFEKQAVEAATFDVRDIKDARRIRFSAIVQRQGQPAFRKLLLEAYEGSCCVSGCSVEAVLEAAHIIPYRGESTNHVVNGILLRGDLHTLFDRGLLSINPKTWRVVASPQIQKTEYGAIHDARIRLPTRPEHWPDAVALTHHGREAGLL